MDAHTRTAQHHMAFAVEALKGRLLYRTQAIEEVARNVLVCKTTWQNEFSPCAYGVFAYIHSTILGCDLSKLDIRALYATSGPLC